MKKNYVLSISGGLDSTALLLNCLKNDGICHCVSFDYGQKHKIELIKLQKNIDYLNSLGFQVHYNKIDLSDISVLLSSALTNKDINVPEGHFEDIIMKDTVVPNRNAIFSSILYGYALSIKKQLNTDIEFCLGVHAGDHAIYPDCKMEFFIKLFAAFESGNWDTKGINFYLPYINSNKIGIIFDLVESCLKLNIDLNTILSNTHTCYNPDENGLACGKCGSCTERMEAFNIVQIEDQIKYQNK